MLIVLVLSVAGLPGVRSQDLSGGANEDYERILDSTLPLDFGYTGPARWMVKIRLRGAGHAPEELVFVMKTLENRVIVTTTRPKELTVEQVAEQRYRSNEANTVPVPVLPVLETRVDSEQCRGLVALGHTLERMKMNLISNGPLISNLSPVEIKLWMVQGTEIVLRINGVGMGAEKPLLDWVDSLRHTRDACLAPRGPVSSDSRNKVRP